MNIYVSAFFESRNRIKPFLFLLEALGHSIVSTWLDEPEYEKPVIQATLQEAKAATGLSEVQIIGIAKRDIKELNVSDFMILDTIDETPRGGREWEYGYFFHMVNGWVLDLKITNIVLVGPERNVFHSLIPNKFSTWEELVQWMRNNTNQK